MPELPEVETTIKGLNSKVLKRTFVDVWTDAKRLVKKPKSFENFKKEIKGKKIIRAWRRAKNVIINLSEGYSLLVHQKMTGHLLYGKWQKREGKWQAPKNGPLADPYNRFLHLIFFLDNNNMLALSDMRKFAKIELWKTEELLNSDYFKKLGPEPLEKNFTFEKFKKIFKNKKGKIKQVLMNQEIIAGIGNIYSDESLWRSKINPLKDVSKLNNKEMLSLYAAIKKVLKKGIELGGESFADYRNIEGKKGNFDIEKKAYQREGQKCFRCKTLLKRIKIGGRSSCFCPYCQKL
ncbi:MAG: bifunctional DNA-formamidopyrimidine glycosylase/DNA-(apurinic or apyrimidinic site) lyase [Patescibacteria group bacterium]